MLESYFIAAVIFAGVYWLYRHVKSRRKRKDNGPITGGPLPPDPVDTHEP